MADRRCDPLLLAWDRSLPRLRLRCRPPDGAGPARPDHRGCSTSSGCSPRRASRSSTPRRSRRRRPARPGPRRRLRRGGPRAAAPTPRTARARARARHRGRPGLRRHARGVSAHVVGAHASRRPSGVRPATPTHAVNLAGGLHHAMPRPGARLLRLQRRRRSRSAGCWTSGAERVAYVDVDVHHGDGVQEAVLRRPAGPHHQPARDRRARCSRAPAARRSRGAPAPRAPRSTSRCRRGPGTPVAARVPRRRARRCCAAFGPTVLVSQHGCDSHVEDPLAHLALTVDGQRASYAALHALAHELGRRPLGGDRWRWLRRRRRRAAGWTHLLAEATGSPVPTGDRGAGGLARPRPADVRSRRAATG